MELDKLIELSKKDDLIELRKKINRRLSILKDEERKSCAIESTAVREKQCRLIIECGAWIYYYKKEFELDSLFSTWVTNHKNTNIYAWYLFSIGRGHSYNSRYNRKSFWEERLFPKLELAREETYSIEEDTLDDLLEFPEEKICKEILQNNDWTDPRIPELAKWAYKKQGIHFCSTYSRVFRELGIYLCERHRVRNLENEVKEAIVELPNLAGQGDCNHRFRYGRLLLSYNWIYSCRESNIYAKIMWDRLVKDFSK